MKAHVELEGQEGGVRYLAITEPQVTVGSSPSAGIPLVNASELAAEHFLLAPRKEGCWVGVAQGVETPLLCGDDVLTGQVVAWGSTFTVGDLRFRLKEGSPPGPALFKAGAKPTLGADLSKNAFLGLVLVFWAVARFFPWGGDDDLLRGEVPEPTALFGNLAVACPVGAARELGDSFAYEALARMDRYAFDAEEGIFSVEAHSRAIACYQKVPDSVAAEAEERRRDALVEKIEEDYRARNLHLRRSIKNKDYQRALELDRELIVMVRTRRSSEYLRWLAKIERQLIAKLRQEAAAKKKSESVFDFF